MSFKNSSKYYESVKTEVKHLSNIMGILEKIEMDRNLEVLGSLLSEILRQETFYAFSGFLIRTSKIRADSRAN